ncbi:MAG: aminotransferase class III-fold pyridoxal phosphate-dependent enzyme [Deltaproteobacteria bacterium]|nr:aminotransferase class III-fold pyridoxal phosphate-dependent enzyme [Deltaproteobacteria bacterium]MBW2420389.1 aminotransferase class III-fold pyridoxal phosphate-dependent enzyme [Deltaproteobacteria bacterium]
MAKRNLTPLDSLLDSDAIRDAARQLIQEIQDESAERVLSPKAYLKCVREVERLRGRPLLYPMLTSGCGRGARVRLSDGSTKLDLVGGIGVYAFGHGDPDLLETAVVAAASDVVYQGHLMPGPEYLKLSRALLRHAGPRIKHAWLSLSGAMANENALKIIFQKHAPADHIIVFDRSFHGRTLKLAELTDRPAFREGLPTNGKVLHVPFYDPADPDSTEKSLTILDRHLRRRPGRIAGMCMELVQGEGGFHTAPREFFEALMGLCKEAGIAVWVDEVQTFVRTGELFAYRTLGLDDYVDVVTAGKLLQGSATLFTKAYNPKPGLVAGTYAGNTVGMAVGTRIIERLEGEGYLGDEGRIVLLGRRIEKRFLSLEKRMPRAVGPRSGMGAMQAFVPWNGAPAVTKAILETAFENGLVLLSAGSEPAKIRLLPPVNTTDEELEAAFTILEKTLREVSEKLELSC